MIEPWVFCYGIAAALVVGVVAGGYVGFRWGARRAVEEVGDEVADFLVREKAQREGRRRKVRARH